MPQRIQLSRQRGYRKPEGAIVVSRPSKWGNPFAVREMLTPDSPLWPYLLGMLPDGLRSLRSTSLTIRDREMAVAAHGWWFIEQPHLMLTVREELGGHDLACWCPLVDKNGEPVPCHADLLLELAASG